jgi:hypothetical protein
MGLNGNFAMVKSVSNFYGVKKRSQIFMIEYLSLSLPLFFFLFSKFLTFVFYFNFSKKGFFHVEKKFEEIMRELNHWIISIEQYLNLKEMKKNLLMVEM